MNHIAVKERVVKIHEDESEHAWHFDTSLLSKGVGKISEIDATKWLCGKF